ncbi:copper resistance CopC family protein [Stackebrandtia nassauensis]|uniref:Copper resistance protein CopC n=1 Tax=Stackebrandtia nassauensis (strain DSM 44728 / CIP 108903 / NRRL B-16338 / NBRC 102104 / LLR-40K-21) TaxID=446470 RepID=D3QA26_STANL|nr:copper resistance CopC family protein [Stackebrandtia nassauensis]ADD40738.1 copper resistance protein CopC [Stackebrandtia nassauensis DSM 44728]
MRILRILSGALLGAALLIPVTATPASAHVALVSSDPKDGAKLDEAPETVELTFSEVLDAPSTKVAVIKPDGENLDVAKPSIEDKTITQALKLPVKGEYTVSYRIVSEDGHPVEDSISFSVASVPKENQEPSSAAESADEETKDTDEAATTDSGLGWGPVALVAAGVVVVVVVVVLLVRRRSRDS